MIGLMTRLVDIKNLTLAFQNQGQLHKAVEQINFTLGSAETLALLGESGCGKSLTAQSLIRLLPANALYGRDSAICFDGQDLLNLPESVMRSLRGRRIALIFQEPMTALNPVLTIAEQLVEALPLEQRTGSAVQECLINLLYEVEMPMPELRLSQYPHQLSGGQKQRVVIAMAIASNPEILIADEPTTALDVTIQTQILNLLKKLQQRHQMSLLLITHDLAVVKAMADRVCVLYAGQVVAQAAVADFFAEIRHPYVQQLLASLPSFSKRNQHLAVIPGLVPRLDNLPSGCRFHPRCAHVFAPCSTEEPALQQLAKQEVRCHLYPQRKDLPALETLVKQRKLVIEQGEILLSVLNLAVYFPTSKKLFGKKNEPIKAVDSLSFNLYKGRTLALVGESGCGKTTTSRALLRLQAINAGELRYQGEDICAMRGAALRNYRKKVQIIFQDPFSAMNPRMTVGEILAEGMRVQGLSSLVIGQRQRQLLDQVNLPTNSIDRYPHQFSGGQRQRICIARALATEPDLLICDEPTSALDVSVQAQILNLLKDLQEERGLTYLFITHNMAVVSYLADEVLVMKEGRAVEEGTCEQILQSPQQAYTRELLSSVLEL